MKISIDHLPKRGESWSEQEAAVVVIGEFDNPARPYGSCFMPLSEASGDFDLAVLRALKLAAVEALRRKL